VTSQHHPRAPQSLPHRLSVDRLRAALLRVRAASRADARQPTGCVGSAAPRFLCGGCPLTPPGLLLGLRCACHGFRIPPQLPGAPQL
jgi:hypothetical protein